MIMILTTTIISLTTENWTKASIRHHRPTRKAAAPNETMIQMWCFCEISITTVRRRRLVYRKNRFDRKPHYTPFIIPINHWIVRTQPNRNVAEVVAAVVLAAVQLRRIIAVHHRFRRDVRSFCTWPTSHSITSWSCHRQAAHPCTAPTETSCKS